MAFQNPIFGQSMGKFAMGALVLGAISAASLAYAASGPMITTALEWNTPGEPIISAPVRNSRLNQQPRPESAPTGFDGNAVDLTGEIESCPLPRQPRPMSAVPRHLDTLVDTL